MKTYKIPKIKKVADINSKTADYSATDLEGASGVVAIAHLIQVCMWSAVDSAACTQTMKVL